MQIAQKAGGEYFEIGRDSDREVAFNVIDRLHRQANVTQQVESFEDLYWRFLLAAAAFLIGAVALMLRSIVRDGRA